MKKELDEIYNLYAVDLYKFILKLSHNESLAMDILQDTMLKAVMSADKFKGESSVKTWLCTIARNEYYNHLKRADNNNLPLDEALNVHGEPLEHCFTDKSQALQIHRILHKLDEPYKEIFTLRVFAELRFSDIGGIFGKSENWARVTFFRAKEKIVNLLKEEDSI